MFSKSKKICTRSDGNLLTYKILELRLVRFMFSKEEEEEEDEESVKIMYFVPCGINFIQFFACSYFLTCSPP